jgi:hypothetical protein
MARYLGCLRFELLTTLGLLALPLGASSPLIGNLFHLETWLDLALVVALGCLAAWQVMVMVLLALVSAPTQLDLPALRIPAWVLAWRVPLFTLLAVPLVVTVAVAAVVVVTFTLAQQDHYFTLVGPPAAVAVPAPAGVRAWLAAQPAGPRPVMVVVTAAGGGIRAAAWTARVLGQLEARIPGFHRSVALLSAVSGGAVGTMYFLDAVESWRRSPSDDDRTRVASAVYDHAAASSLTAIAWGLVYPDLSRAFPSPVLLTTPAIVDRAWMMEQAWNRELSTRSPGGRPARLSEWTERVRTGDLPPFVFNATSVETGRRVLFGAVRIVDPDGHQAVGVWHFDDLYPERDIAVTTAARLSATFPYVSPVARARDVTPGQADVVDPQSDHFADGGYSDNFGIATAVDWLRAVLPVARSQVAAVLVLRIQLERDSSVTHLPGIVNEVLGPVATLYEVRDATQTARNSVALALLAETARDGPPVCEFVFMPTPTDARPLSWHLTNAERAEIRDQWTPYEGHAEQIARWLRGTPADCPAPGT